MLKKTIAYTDYNGTTRKEDFYFNLTQAEVTELEVSVEGGLVEMINRIVAAQNGKVIIETFQGHHSALLTVRSLRMAVDSLRTRKSAMPSLRQRRTATCSWNWQPTLGCQRVRQRHRSSQDGKGSPGRSECRSSRCS